jgi:hypothetical protein
MVHGVKGSSEEIYRYFPIFFSLENGCLLGRNLVVPNKIDFCYEFSITAGLSIYFKIFLKD